MAVTSVVAFIVTEQDRLPGQFTSSPLQRAKTAPFGATGLRTTLMPRLNRLEQVAIGGQSIPDGELRTSPPPAVVTLRTGRVTKTLATSSKGPPSARTKLAETELSRRTTRVHKPARPMQARPHPLKRDRTFGLAIKITVALFGNEPEQVVPHSIPGGTLVTPPCAFPLTATRTLTVESNGGCPSLAEAATPPPIVAAPSTQHTPTSVLERRSRCRRIVIDFRIWHQAQVWGQQPTWRAAVLRSER